MAKQNVFLYDSSFVPRCPLQCGVNCETDSTLIIKKKGKAQMTNCATGYVHQSQQSEKQTTQVLRWWLPLEVHNRQR